MNLTVKIDEIDVKILTMLIRDSRTSLKEIAENCGLTSVAILKRIKHLRNSGVITGTTLFPKLEVLGYQQTTTIGINLDYAQQPKIFELIQKHIDAVELSSSVGRYDLSFLAFTKNIRELDDIIQAVRKYPGVKRVVANTWISEPHLTLENLDLQPTKA